VGCMRNADLDRGSGDVFLALGESGTGRVWVGVPEFLR
jgi:hypothetical protein